MEDLSQNTPTVPAPATATDPVCGMTVDPAKARGKAQHQGTQYYFCSPGCMHKFVSDPSKYITAMLLPIQRRSRAALRIRTRSAE